ncbi:MAG: hypothetical protein GF350_06310 [Chitinivibrionales bacterium]|nr:hypothetical protein [Chitinivibrionales bacterium]
MVCDDIGSALSGSVAGHQAPHYRGARLNFSEWKAYWANNGLDNDQNSILSAQSNASYNLLTNELTITIDYDPSSVGAAPVDGLDTDILGNPIPGDGSAHPGPIQGLSQGTHTFQLWPPQNFPDFPLPASARDHSKIPASSTPRLEPEWKIAPVNGRISIPHDKNVQSLAIYSLQGKFITRIDAGKQKSFELNTSCQTAHGVKMVQFEY